MKKSYQINMEEKAHRDAKIEAVLKGKTIGEVIANKIYASKLERGGRITLGKVARLKGIAHLDGTKAAVDSIGLDSDLAPGVTAVDVSAFQAAYARPIYEGLNFIPVPFKTLPYLLTGATAAFIGDKIPIKASAPTTGSLALDRTKVSVLLVTSNELLQSSEFENIIQAEAFRAISACINTVMFDTTTSAVSNTTAGCINPVDSNTIDASTVDTPADVLALIGEMVAELLTGGSNIENVVIVFNSSDALAISLLSNTDGERAFPGLSALGGMLAGFPVFTSTNAPTGIVTAFDVSELMVAQDDNMTVALSENALIDQSNSPAGSNYVSMFQSESTAFRFTKYVNWQMRNDFVSLANGLSIALPTISS